MRLFAVLSFAANKYKEISHFVRNDTSLFVKRGCGETVRLRRTVSPHPIYYE